MDRKIHKLYIYILFAIAVCMVWVLYGIDSTVSLWAILFWTIFGVISESFHIILPSGASTSVGMAVYLAVLVTWNPLMAIIVAAISFLLRMPEIDGERMHLFKFKSSIVLYNVSSHIITIGLMGIVYTSFIDTNSLFSEKIIYGLVIFSFSELVNLLFITIYFYTRTTKNNIPLFRTFIGALPSSLSVGTLGMFLAYAHETNGVAFVALFFIPLLLARYSFKLYFDSQKTGQETIEALNAALHYRDAYTAGHTCRVEVWTLMLAKKMGYNGKDLERIKTAARLHDIGKIGVPDRILNKPGKLTDEEYQRIKDHSAMGAQILSNVDTLNRITEIVRQHHERPDGKGYPDGLVGEAISLDASILSIADTYDAMTSKRPYRNAMTNEYATSELRKYRGTQFRSDLVEVFIESLASMDPSELEFEESIIYEKNAEIIAEGVIYDH